MLRTNSRIAVTLYITVMVLIAGLIAAAYLHVCENTYGKPWETRAR